MSEHNGELLEMDASDIIVPAGSKYRIVIPDGQVSVYDTSKRSNSDKRDTV